MRAHGSCTGTPQLMHCIASMRCDRRFLLYERYCAGYGFEISCSTEWGAPLYFSYPGMTGGRPLSRMPRSRWPAMCMLVTLPRATPIVDVVRPSRYQLYQWCLKRPAEREKARRQAWRTRVSNDTQRGAAHAGMCAAPRQADEAPRARRSTARAASRREHSARRTTHGARDAHGDSSAGDAEHIAAVQLGHAVSPCRTRVQHRVRRDVRVVAWDVTQVELCTARGRRAAVVRHHGCSLAMAPHLRGVTSAAFEGRY